MRINEIITEVQDNPYPFTIKNLGYKDYQAKVTLPDGATLYVEIFWQETVDSWEVRYYKSEEHNATDSNTSDAFRVFATIIAVIKRFIVSKKPKTIKFRAYKIEGDRDAASGIKLYNRLVQRYASAWGYDAKISPSRDMILYTLNKKPGIKTDVTDKN